MGKVLSVVQRKMNRFNVETRAHKVISKEKPTPAPMHPYAKEQLEKIIKDHPEIIQEHQRKDADLYKRLTQVYVTSDDPEVNPETVKYQSESKASLPQIRNTPDDPEFGFHEPTMIPYGRITMRQALKLLQDHQSDSKIWTAEAIANKYNLSPQLSGNILRYFQVFEIYIPDAEDKSTKIASTDKTRITIEGGKSL